MRLESIDFAIQKANNDMEAAINELEKWNIDESSPALRAAIVSNKRAVNSFIRATLHLYKHCQVSQVSTEEGE